MPTRILIIEDEASIREMLRYFLEKNGFSVTEAEDSKQAYLTINQAMPDLIILDWMLPGHSGIEIARRLRKDDLTKETPIIMLTAKGEEDDKVFGLNTGVDDYLVKPFSNRELLARIKALIRRSYQLNNNNTIKKNGLTIDLSSHRVYANDQLIHMGPKEFKLLHFFMTHAERVYSRSQLLDYIWGNNTYIEERTIDVHIRRLRKTLAPYECNYLIQTVRGTGYRFSTTVK